MQAMEAILKRNESFLTENAAELTKHMPNLFCHVHDPDQGNHDDDLIKKHMYMNNFDILTVLELGLSSSGEHTHIISIYYYNKDG